MLLQTFTKGSYTQFQDAVPLATLQTTIYHITYDKQSLVSVRFKGAKIRSNAQPLAMMFSAITCNFKHSLVPIQ
jgi:hypothetical protein